MTSLSLTPRRGDAAPGRRFPVQRALLALATLAAIGGCAINPQPFTAQEQATQLGATYVSPATNTRVLMSSDGVVVVRSATIAAHTPDVSVPRMSPIPPLSALVGLSVPPSTRGEAPSISGSDLLASTPLERFGEPDEIARWVTLLLDDDTSGWVTGVLFPVDGGRTS